MPHRSLTIVLFACAGFAQAASFSVTNQNDDGPGSLRAAIIGANASSDAPHFINFNAGVTLIGLQSPLPALTRTTLVNGFGSQRVMLQNDSGACFAAPSAGLSLEAPDSLIRNIAISGCFHFGMHVKASAPNSSLRGVSVNGTGSNGLRIEAAGTLVEPSNSQDSRVLNAGLEEPDLNLVEASAIRITNASNVTIRGTAIGSTVVDGTRGHGIHATNAHGLHIGVLGSDAVLESERNAIGGNRINGIHIVNSNNVQIRGNHIGNGASGLWHRNGRGVEADAGIRIESTGAVLTGTVIGGQGATRGNEIGNTRGNGILLIGNVQGAVIESNRIGAPSISGAIPNTLHGIHLNNGVTGTRIGDFAADRHNLIAANTGAGLRFNALETQDNVVYANSITGNSAGGILTANGAQAMPEAIASITQISPTIAGTGPTNGLIQLYADSGSQGRWFLDTAFVDGAGQWTSNLDLSAHAGRNLTVIGVSLMSIHPRSGAFSAPFAIPGIQRNLSVSKVGAGEGLVSSSPAGIDCGLDCAASFADGSAVKLTATASAGSVWVGWSGACIGNALTCSLTLNANLSVTANFSLQPQFLLSVTREGSGRVSSDPAGIDCGSSCSAAFADGTQVTLTALAEAGWQFAGWSGSGCGGTGTCQVLIDQARSVSASFTPVAGDDWIFGSDFEAPL